MAANDALPAILRLLVASYPTFTISKETVAAYSELLSDIDPELIKVATLQHISDSRFFPTISELRAAAFRVKRGPRPSANEAWGLVWGVIARGADQDSIPEMARQAVADSGGWTTLRMSENATADRARFIEAFKARELEEEHQGTMLPQVRIAIERLAPPARVELPAPPLRIGRY